jgi:hypothetical protein
MTMSISTWPFFRIALLVTGKGEAQFLPALFRSLETQGHCTFKVARKIEQQRPIRSAKRIEKMVGKGTPLTTRDEDIGLLVRNLLRGSSDYVMKWTPNTGPLDRGVFVNALPHFNRG